MLQGEKSDGGLAISLKGKEELRSQVQIAFPFSSTLSVLSFTSFWMILVQDLSPFIARKGFLISNLSHSY